MCVTQSLWAKTFLTCTRKLKLCASLVPEQSGAAKLNLSKRYFNKTLFLHSNKSQTLIKPRKHVTLLNLMPKLECTCNCESEYKNSEIMIKYSADIKSKKYQLSLWHQRLFLAFASWRARLFEEIKIFLGTISPICHSRALTEEAHKTC